MDSAAEFDRKTRAMFGRYRRFAVELSFRFFVNILEELVEATPGFENQDPSDTEYQPTGRLRGGYVYSETPIATAGRWDGGPLSFYGVETVARIENDMRVSGPHSFYVINEVAYAYIVLLGLGNHARPRDFIGETAAPTTQTVMFKRALRSMKDFR